MKIVAKSVALACLLSVLLLPLEAATGVRILSGSLEFASGEAVIDMKGTDGFRFLGGGNTSGGRFDPASECGCGCPSGTSVSLGASWGGFDLSGTATLRGERKKPAFEWRRWPACGCPRDSARTRGDDRPPARAPYRAADRDRAAGHRADRVIPVAFVLHVRSFERSLGDTLPQTSQ
jgi:hypothetical protein